MVSPFITFVVPVPQGAVGSPAVVMSLLAQESPDWQAVVVGGPQDYFPDPRVRVLAEESSLAAAIAAGLRAAEGEFVSVVNPGATVASGAVAELLHASTDADLVYSDEVIDGELFSKPSFSPERLRGQFYLGGSTALRRTLVDSSGGIRQAIAGAEIYDLVLRMTRSTSKVAHVASALYSSAAPSLETQWLISDDTRLASVRRALALHLDATGGGTVESVSATGVYSTHRSVSGQPLVSIVIPTRGSEAVVRGANRCMIVEAVRGIVERSTYANFEFVVVIDTVADDAVREQLVQIAGDRMRFVDWAEPFSFSGKMNLGAVHARGEYLLLLNDDVELITPGWIEPMLALAQRDGAGLVGAMLYFEDDTIQHAGHAYYKLDVTHIGLHSERGATGPFGAFLLEREVVGVTAAAAMISKAAFFAAGGFSTLLPGNFNDVDLCMKLNSLGYQSYWTPAAELYHFESKSRDPRVGKYEIDTAWGRWEHLFWDSPLWPTDPHEVFTA